MIKLGPNKTLVDKVQGAQTIQGGILFFQFPSTWAYYSMAQIVQGGIVFKEIR